MCGNYSEVNARIALPTHAMGDCASALDHSKKFRIKSGIDVKAGFNNIPVPKELQTYLAIVTQDGVYVPPRGPFGVNALPSHFQFAMTQALSKGECCPIFSVFVDDTSTGGD